MKAVTLASILFAGAAVAAPVVEKRGVTTDVVVTTIWTTTTVYVDQPTAAAFFEKSSKSSSSSVAPTSAPPPASSSAAYVAPAAPSVPAVPVTTKTPETPATSAGNTGTSTPQGQTFTGDATYYDVLKGQGSCGKPMAGSSDAVVAVSGLQMAKYNNANPNLNPLCYKSITIQGENGPVKADVYDTCPECTEGSLDLSTGFFKQVFPSGDGRVHNVKWWFNN